MRKKLLIIDSNSLIHRAFHALPPLTTKEGNLVNALYGFLLIFLKFKDEFNPSFVAAAFDYPAPTFRHRQFKEYKAKRPKMPGELAQQIPEIKKALKAFGVPIFEKEGFEADDIIGTIARIQTENTAQEIETIILSGDFDLLQLVNEHTKVCIPQRGIKNISVYDLRLTKEKYEGLKPNQFIDYRGLKGDPSDNIPGIPGIGPKTAIYLIKKFGNLENLYQELEKRSPKSGELKESLRRKLKEYKEQAFLSKGLSRVFLKVPIDFKLSDCSFGNYDKNILSNLFKKFGFSTLLKRINHPPLKEGKQLSLGDF